jgi:hypothetical protein
MALQKGIKELNQQDFFKGSLKKMPRPKGGMRGEPPTLLDIASFVAIGIIFILIMKWFLENIWCN